MYLIPDSKLARAIHLALSVVSALLLIGCVLMTYWSYTATEGWISIGVLTIIAWIVCVPVMVTPVAWPIVSLIVGKRYERKLRKLRMEA